MNGGYVMVPAWFLDMNPDGAELRIYCTLARFGRFDTARGVYEECRPSIPTLAEAAGMSETHTKRALGGLMDKKAIERRLRFAEDGKTPIPSVYRVIFGELVGPGDGPTGSAGGPTPGAADEPRVGPPADGNPEPPTQNQDTQKKRSTSARGTRLPEDFTVTEQMRSWFVEQGLGQRIDGLAEHEKFLDYYRANGRTHKDWVAAWRFWMRRAADRPTRKPSSAPSGGFRTAAERSAERLADERDLLLIAEEIVEREGGDPERDQDRVWAIVKRLKEEREKGSAPRTDGTYSGSSTIIDGEVVPQREVTAGEG